MKPISPIEAKGKKIETIEPEIIEATNELIIERLSGRRAEVLQKDIVARYKVVCKRKSKRPLSEDVLYKKHQLDIEDVFRQAGWSVTYDKPGYNESYDASFIFKQK